MATMYELTNDYLKLLEFASDPDIDGEMVAGAIEYTLEEIEFKAENTAKVLRMLEAEADALKNEEARLYARRKTIENNIARIKDSLYNAMKITGKEKFKTALFSFNIQKNPVKLVIDDESKVPKKYLIPQPAKIDNATLKEELKAGATKKYCHLEQTESLRIR